MAIVNKSRAQAFQIRNKLKPKQKEGFKFNLKINTKFDLIDIFLKKIWLFGGQTGSPN
jgi:hypothetical protein